MDSNKLINYLDLCAFVMMLTLVKKIRILAIRDFLLFEIFANLEISLFLFYDLLFLDVKRLMFTTKAYMISFNFMTNCIRLRFYGYIPNNIKKHIQERDINPQELQVHKTANIKFRKRM